MKSLDIAIKDMIRSFRSFFAIIFMFIVPLLVTGMFYFMFGNIAGSGGFDLPRTKVIVVNLDQGGPKFNLNPRNIPGGKKARTMGDLIVSILQSEDMSDLIEPALAADAGEARAAVDGQAAQVAIIIPADFSKQFADLNGEAFIEFYQDPALTIGPNIIRAIIHRFMDGMAGVKIAVNVFIDEADPKDQQLAGQVAQQYLKISLAQAEDLEGELLDVRPPANSSPGDQAKSTNLLVRMIGPIMGGMMIFYAFYTGTSTAQSILREEEERTLPRLFTTPTSQAAILTGKFLAVFMTVFVQVITLLVAARLIFGIQWGNLFSVALAALGIVLSASSFGILVNSFLKNTRQGGVVFGGVLTATGMIGMIRIFAMNSPSAAKLGDTVSLLVPQGWAVRGLMQAMNNQPFPSVLMTALVMLVWSAAFFAIGVWRFNKRYA